MIKNCVPLYIFWYCMTISSKILSYFVMIAGAATVIRLQDTSTCSCNCSKWRWRRSSNTGCCSSQRNRKESEERPLCVVCCGVVFVCIQVFLCWWQLLVYCTIFILFYLLYLILIDVAHKEWIAPNGLVWKLDWLTHIINARARFFSESAIAFFLFALNSAQRSNPATSKRDNSRHLR